MYELVILFNNELDDKKSFVKTKKGKVDFMKT